MVNSFSYSSPGTTYTSTSTSQDPMVAQLQTQLARLKAQQDINNFKSGATSNPFGDYTKFYSDLSNQAFGQQQKMMGLSNEYRTKEGATQGQMDEQAYRRQDAQLQTQKYINDKGIQNQQFMQGREIGSREKMQQNSFDNVEKQRGLDAARAQAALRSSSSLF